MSIVASIKDQIPPMHREGRPFVAIFAVATLLLFWAWSPLGYLGIVLTVWCFLFFRDPARVTPVREGLVVSPADGRVCLIATVPPPKELADELGPNPRLRVSIFMSVFDCHVNRAPVNGKLIRMAYVPGKFLNADLDKASEDNERNALCIESAAGRFGVVQIAGLIARRIVPFVREGENLAVGDRFGLIRFGSRVDVYFPEGARSLVGIDQRCIAGETVLADLSGDIKPVTFKVA